MHEAPLSPKRMIKTWATGRAQHWRIFVYNARTPAANPKRRRKEPPASTDEPALGAPEELEEVLVPLGLLPLDVGFPEFPPDPDPDPDPLVLVAAGATEVERKLLLIQAFRHVAYWSVCD